MLNFAVLDHDINNSDHLPLSIYIDTDVRDQNVNVGRMNNINHTPVSKQLIWDKADLVSYYYHTGTLLLPILSRVDELLLQSSDNITDAHTLCTGIDSVYDEITQVLITASRLYVPDRVKIFINFGGTKNSIFLRKLPYLLINYGKLPEDHDKVIFLTRQSS